MSATRTVAVWCPDWPVTAAVAGAATAAASAAGSDVTRIDADDAAHMQPVVVVTANRVVACNRAAREHGVRRGLLRREAQYRCPSVTVLPRDDLAEARLFEPVVVTLESIAPGVEIIRPGLAALRLRGPARFYGGEPAAVAAVGERVNAVTEAWVGVADGAFAAGLAAREGRIIAAGSTPAYLAPMPITVFGSRTEVALVDLLLRLGLRTLGDFAALPAADVASRLGPAGVWAHQMAGGIDLRPVAGRTPPLECSVEIAFEPPLDRADAVAFSARVTAEQFVDTLAKNQLACVCFEAQADTDAGEQIVRRWRYTGPLSAEDVIDRIRWQLEGLFASSPARSSSARAERLTGAVTRLRLVPIDTMPTGDHQQTMFAGAFGRHSGGQSAGHGAASESEDDKRVQRGLARVQTQFGHETVNRIFVQGGNSPAARTGQVVWGEPLPAAAVESVAHPWPGRLPAPSPARILDPPHPVTVLDDARRAVTISERAVVSSPPAWLCVAGREPLALSAWAGPWPRSEAWWETSARRDPVLACQLVDVHGRAYVVTYRLQGGWLLEGLYD